MLFSVLSYVLLFIAIANIAKFAVPYAIGVLFSLASTFFLIGPLRQLKQMFKKKRIIATIMMLTSIILLLIMCFLIKNKLAKLVIVGTLLVV